MQTALALIPYCKKCKFCQRLTITRYLFEGKYFFFCSNCKELTKWTDDTLLHNCKISFTILEKLVVYYIRNKSIKEIADFLEEISPSSTLAKNTVIHYVKLFNTIALEYYKKKSKTMLLEGEVELDETFLFKMKKSSAKHRPYQSKSIWLFGIIQRDNKQFIIVPVQSRDKSTLIPIILRNIKIGATIYSDCFSTYVNNNTFPKKSSLTDYGYHHQWVNHKMEFVSKDFSHIHTNNIERLWLTIKSDFRKKNIKKFSLFHIARFFFHHTLTEHEQLIWLAKNLMKDRRS